MLGMVRFVALTVVLACAAVPATADQVLFSNLSPEQYRFSYGASPDYDFAASFEVPVRAELDGVALRLSINQEGASSGVQVALFADTGGFPGDVLETFAPTVIPVFSDSSGLETVAFDSALSPLLQPATPYWLRVSITDAVTRASWYANPIGDVGRQAWWLKESRTWSVTPPGNDDFTLVRAAFQVTGAAPSAPIPEPTSMFLLTTGLAAVSARHWRRRRRR